MIFNVGARRSGTYWLQRVVCAHPDVAEVPSETYLFSMGISQLVERFQHEDKRSAEVAKVWIDRPRLIDSLRWFCDSVFEPLLEPPATRLAERTPWHVYHLPLIAEIYPDARFVHIIRDGRDSARSLAAQIWGPPTLAKAAEEWRSSVAAGLRAGVELGERLSVIRYEEMLAEPEDAIHRLFAHLRLTATPPAMEAAQEAVQAVVNLDRSDPRVGTGKWRGTWSRRDLRTFNRVAGDLLEELGYH